jgi:hypothetical protein
MYLYQLISHCFQKNVDNVGSKDLNISKIYYDLNAVPGTRISQNEYSGVCRLHTVPA